MIRKLLCFACVLSALCLVRASAAPTWPDALAKMPFRPPARQLNRTNCVETMLAAFRSNEVIKAFIFMPGATDEFYMFRRARAQVPAGDLTLLDAVHALTNQTLIRATFRAPFLLLHTAEDPLEPDVRVHDAEMRRRLEQKREVSRLLCNDWDWGQLQPVLRRALKVDLRPWQDSSDSWHFYRHSLAAWGLNGFEALEAAAMAGKSRFTISRRQVVFEVDPRIRAVPTCDEFPR